MEGFFLNNQDFERFSMHHWLPVLLFALFGIWLIRRANNTWTDEQKWKIPFYISLSLPITIIFWMVSRSIKGEFDASVDLPIHMCNFMSLLIPFMFVKKNQLLFGIIYFWVLSGTLQAIVTPGLEQAPPHYWYFRYWLIHCMLVIFILYSVLVLKYRPYWKDFWNAIIALNIFLVLAFAINSFLGSNYLYTMAKPEQGSMLDLFGPWPYYILVSEFMAVIFFLIYFIPFLLKKSKE